MVRNLRPLLSSSSILLRNSRSISIAPLAFEEIPSSNPDAPTAFVLHGLLGSGRNWRSFARALASRLHDHSRPPHGIVELMIDIRDFLCGFSNGQISPWIEAMMARMPAEPELRSEEDLYYWRMVLVDLRNHGKSAGLKGLDPPHDMVNAARDLANLVVSQKWKWPEVVIGHSMGGKVALEYARSCSCGDYGAASMLPKQMWVLDSVPGEVSTDDSDGEVERVLKTLESLPSPLPSRRWVVDRMIQLGFSRSLSEWIGSNLKNAGGNVVWTFDIQAAIAMFNSYRETSYWPLLEHPPRGLEINIVRAEKSDRWSPAVVQQLESLSRKQQAPDEGKVSVHTLKESGHWVHVDNPNGLLDIMAPNFVAKT